MRQTNSMKDFSLQNSKESEEKEIPFQEKPKKTNIAVRVLFIIRAILWITAALATVYWIYWSFKLYKMGIHDVHEYSDHFRPIFGRCLLISLASLCFSLILRSISDMIKKKMQNKAVRGLFIIRVVLWITATVATLYWLYWSFKLFEMGMLNAQEHSNYFTPIFGWSVLISIVSICLSLIFRNISKKISMEDDDDKLDVNPM